MSLARYSTSCLLHVTALHVSYTLQHFMSLTRYSTSCFLHITALHVFYTLWHFMSLTHYGTTTCLFWRTATQHALRVYSSSSTPLHSMQCSAGECARPAMCERCVRYHSTPPERPGWRMQCPTAATRWFPASSFHQGQSCVCECVCVCACVCVCVVPQNTLNVTHNTSTVGTVWPTQCSVHQTNTVNTSSGVRTQCQ